MEKDDPNVLAPAEAAPNMPGAAVAPKALAELNPPKPGALAGMEPPKAPKLGALPARPNPGALAPAPPAAPNAPPNAGEDWAPPKADADAGAPKAPPVEAPNPPAPNAGDDEADEEKETKQKIASVEILSKVKATKRLTRAKRRGALTHLTKAPSSARCGPKCATKG